MVFRLFLLCTLSLFAIANTFNKELNHHFSKIKGDDTESIRSFNNIKMLYLDTILSENQKNQFAVLSKLLKASSIINVKIPSSYTAEFSRLSEKYDKAYKKPKQQKNKAVQKTKVRNLISVKKQYNGIFLNFNKSINKKNIKYKLWESKGYYYHIYDIENSNSKINTKTIDFNVGKLRIGQYKKNIVRVSLRSKYKRLSTFYTYKNKINISFRSSKTKTAQKKKPKKTNKYTNKKTNRIPAYEVRNNSNSFKNKVIIIDPGHGGKDPGALGVKGVKEKNIVLKISTYLKKYLQDKGFKVYLTRYGNNFIDLKRRTKLANVKKADLFISIHANASLKARTKGIETYFLSTSKSQKAKNVALRENSLGVKSLDSLSKNVLLNIVNRQKIVASNKLAIDIQRNMLAYTSKKGYKVKDHGVRGGPFWVLVGARMPNVLIEVGYLTNSQEARRLQTKAYQKTLAQGIAMGIESYLEKN